MTNRFSGVLKVREPLEDSSFIPQNERIEGDALPSELSLNRIASASSVTGDLFGQVVKQIRVG